MAWSSYAHLPNSEDDYWEILSKLEDDMPVKKVDEIIAAQKKKSKVSHHYRSNLAKIGFFKVSNNTIKLNYDSYELKWNKSYLRTVFRNVLINNSEEEVLIIWDLITRLHTYDLKSIVYELVKMYPFIDYNNFIRWLRPLISLMRFADILSIKRNNKDLLYACYVQEAYLKIANSYIKTISLEALENELKKIDPSLDLISILDYVLNNHSIKFKIELLMMPNWATRNRSYKIGQDVYTHIKIKSDLLKEELL